LKVAHPCEGGAAVGVAEGKAVGVTVGVIVGVRVWVKVGVAVSLPESVAVGVTVYGSFVALGTGVEVAVAGLYWVGTDVDWSCDL
jgi:hypothetical protein